MEWTTVTRRTRQRRSPRQSAVSEERSTSSCSSRVFQIFVTEAVMEDVAPSDKVSDVVRKIPSFVWCSTRDVHATFQGKVLKKSDAVKACGIREESTLHIHH